MIDEKNDVWGYSNENGSIFYLGFIDVIMYAKKGIAHKNELFLIYDSENLILYNFINRSIA